MIYGLNICILEMQAEIRKLSVEGIDRIIEIARESWKWTYSGIYSEEYIENWIQGKYSLNKNENPVNRSQTQQDLIFLGAFVDRKLVGFIEIKISFIDSEILGLYLRPDYTHKKIGRKLLVEGEKVLKERGVCNCRPYVQKLNNVGLSFYAKNGFEIKGSEENEFVMEKNLFE